MYKRDFGVTSTTILVKKRAYVFGRLKCFEEFEIILLLSSLTFSGNH